MANPLPLSERIEEIQAEIDELINKRVDELRTSTVGVPRDWIKQSLFARNGGLCRCELAIMVLNKEEEKNVEDANCRDRRPGILAQRMGEKDEGRQKNQPKPQAERSHGPKNA